MLLLNKCKLILVEGSFDWGLFGSNWLGAIDLVAVEWCLLRRFDEIWWFGTQRISQILRTECLLKVSLFVGWVQCVDDGLDIRIAPHLTDVPAIESIKAFDWIVTIMWPRRIWHLRVEIVFMYEYSANTRQHGDYIPIQQSVEKREECRVH